MDRGTNAKPKRASRLSNGLPAAAKSIGLREGGSAKAPAETASASREELRARVDKLERANTVLRFKNKELRIVSVEAAERVDALTLQLANVKSRAGRKTRHEAPAAAL